MGFRIWVRPTWIYNCSKCQPRGVLFSTKSGGCFGELSVPDPLCKVELLGAADGCSRLRLTLVATRTCQPLTHHINDQIYPGLTVQRSCTCGSLGHQAERIAETGHMGLCFTHPPASIAPGLCVPDGAGGARCVLDQSASVVAKSEVIMCSCRSDQQRG